MAILFRNNWLGQFLMKRACPDGYSNGLHFMTMHASKGLEFDAVVIAGISDQIILTGTTT